MPKKIPTAAENPRPTANDHHGSETGKPVARLIVTPMALPMRDAEDAAERGQHDGLGQELKQDLPAARAERLPQADLAGPLGHRDRHDRHHADPADHQRNRRNDDQREQRRLADLIPDIERGVLRDEVEVVRLVQRQPVTDAHDLFDFRQQRRASRRPRAAPPR